MFLIFSKEKIYTYIVSILIVFLLLVVASNENINMIYNSNSEETKDVYQKEVYDEYVNNYLNNKN